MELDPAQFTRLSLIILNCFYYLIHFDVASILASVIAVYGPAVFFLIATLIRLLELALHV